MRELTVIFNKSLKLTNVLHRKITSVELSKNMIPIIIQQMENQIKAKGYHQIGPLIQHTYAKTNKDGELDAVIELMLQSDSYIHHIDLPFTIDSTLRIKNCMYVRFVGEEPQIKYAYDKISVVAYEENITLQGDSYTVYVDRQDDIITADIFMPYKIKEK